VSTPENSFDLVPTHLAVKAMRDNGYRNTAYAIAELIDNSIQAQAAHVELLCCESEELVQQRIRRRIRSIAVLDNGIGMDDELLRVALQFGNGTHLTDRSGIGRFGMGLPSASISQCRKVEVWSWQNGFEKASYSLIDLDLVENRQMRTVPTPEPRALPQMWVAAANSIGATGTLVVWSNLDRPMWRTATTIIKNSEFLIARMYRRFLHQGKITIRMAAFSEEDPSKFTIDTYATANDPGYLMVPSSTPAPYDERQMFQPEGDRWEITQKIAFRGADHDVKIRFSYANEEARNRPNAGATDYGRHASRNIGVSIIREGRELDMDQALVISYNPVERWWGVEVDFPSTLDDLFGVTNNKQAARNFSEVATNFKGMIIGNRESSTQELLDQLIEDEDPSGPLLGIVSLIDRRLSAIRKMLDVQTRGTRGSRRRFDQNSPEHQATEVTRELQQEGRRGQSDADEMRPEGERTEALRRELVETGLTEQQAEELAAVTIQSGIKYTFAEGHLEGRSFFTVRPVAGEIVVKINMSHPAYQYLVGVLEDEISEETSGAELRDRLQRANRGLKLLLMAWARYEDEQPTDDVRMQVQDIRSDWGRVAYRFLRHE
jgi:hypothetical protein